MEKKSKYAELVSTITSVLYVMLVLNVLLVALMNVSIITNTIPAGSSLLYINTGPGVIPVKSFVLVEQTGSLKLLDCIPKDDNPMGKIECDLLRIMASEGSLPITMPSSIGSGTIVAHKENSTYILTAAHVCLDSNSPSGPGTSSAEAVMDFPTYEVTVEYTPQVIIHDYTGNVHSSTVAVANVFADTCIVEAPEVWGLAVPIASSVPPIGTEVQNMAAPLGIWAPGMVLQFEGRYSGPDTLDGKKLSIYTLPVAGGSSGSSVLYNGEIVSMIIMAHRGFNHMGIGVRLEDLHEIMAAF